MASVTLRLTSQPSKLPPQRPADSASRQVCLLHHSCFPAPGYLKRFLQRLPVSHTFPVPKKGAGLPQLLGRDENPGSTLVNRTHPPPLYTHTRGGEGGGGLPHSNIDSLTLKPINLERSGVGEVGRDSVTSWKGPAVGPRIT